ncbi:MAG TPA: hypothetical protein VK915_00480 [Gaiellaceae bacterium]|nr:hypothetical protein [Gaiellaceae bacterium]
MKGRDLLILAGVLLLGGFALADALRDGGAGEAEPKPETATETGVQPLPTTTGPELGHARFPAIPGAGGKLVIVEAGSCAVREFDALTGLELRNVVSRSTCELWAAPVTAKVAVGIGPARGDAVPFRFVDLARPGRNLGNSEAAFGFLAWSEDGQRAAWCNRRRVGIDYELGEGRRQLEGCPAAYTPDGEVAFAVEDRLTAGGRTLVRASGRIVGAHFGEDGSVAVVVEGRRIERYVNGRETDGLDLRGELEGRIPAYAPDNCAALFRTGDEEVALVPLGCSPLAVRSFRGTAGAWSPNGRWVAVTAPNEVAFHPADGNGEPVRWPLGAVGVAWRS